MESAIAELQRMYPNVDRMMCETLLKLHEQGNLQKYVEKLEDTAPTSQSCVLRDGITVENHNIR